MTPLCLLRDGPELGLGPVASLPRATALVGGSPASTLLRAVPARFREAGARGLERWLHLTAQTDVVCV